MKQNILLVDDDHFLTSSLSRLLNSRGFNVASAPTIEDGWNQIVASEPDLAILDLSLPDGDGNDLCQRIREKWDFPIMMLTSRGDSIDKVTGLGMGADDYLTKPFDPHELVARIQALLRRANRRNPPKIGSELLVIGSISIDQNAREVSVKNQNIMLTHTEFDVLQFLAKNRDKVVDRDQLFREIWGYESDFASNTLDVLVYRIRTKLKKAGAEDPIATVRGFGFRLRTTDE